MGAKANRWLGACAAGIGLSAAPAFAQDAARGELLYREHCQRCHGYPPLRGPETAPYNPEMIRSAIDSRVARMSFLAFLSDADLADIATFVGRLLGIEPVPARDYTDLWWTPAEPGWGLSLVQHGAPRHIAFGVLFLYGESKRPLWLVMSEGRWVAPANVEGDLYRVSGPHAAQPFLPSLVGLRPVGRLAIAFSGADAATVTYTVDGVRVEKRVVRQPF